MADLDDIEIVRISKSPPVANPPINMANWVRWMENNLIKAISTGAIQGKDMMARTNDADRLKRQLKDANLTVGEHDAAIKESKRRPAAPANAQLTTDAYFGTGGTPLARVSMLADPVTSGSDGKPIAVKEYVLEGRRNVAGLPWRELARWPIPNITFDPLPAGEEWQFQIRAIGELDQIGEPSAALTRVLAKDTAPPAKPAAPIATSRLGQVILVVLNVTAGGQEMPPDLDYYEVRIATTVNAASSPILTTKSHGTVVVPEQPYNETRWYSVVAVDTSGNRSVESERSPIATKPLVDTDIIDRVISGANLKLDSISEAELSGPVKATLTAANGKNRTFHQATTPTEASLGAFVVGDTWFNTAKGNQISRWSGGGWVLAELGADAIKNLSITNALIADATISDGKIANLDAGKITAGTIDAARIGASTITADKLIVGDITNYLPGGGFDTAADLEAWDDKGDGRIATGNGNAINSRGGLFVEGSTPGPKPWRKFIQVQAGQEWLIQWHDQTTSSYNGTVNNGKIRLGDQDNSVLASYPWGDPHNFTLNTRIYKVPAGVTGLWVTLMFDHSAGTVKIDNLQMRIRNAGDLLVDGAITARTIATNAVTSDAIAANSVDAGMIKANAVTADKIAAGAITAVKIAANSITVEKLAVGDFTNVVDGSDFEDDAKNPWDISSNAFTISTTASRVHSGTRCLAIWGTRSGSARLIPPVSTTEGDRWWIELWASRSADWNGTGSNSKLRIGDQNGALLYAVNYAATSMAANAAPVKLTGSFLVPAGVTGLSMTLGNDATAGNVWIDDIIIRRMTPGQLIVNGSITSTEIATNAITATHIATNAVTADAIKAGSIDGMTITGALIRTAASGARTEMTNQGIRVLNASGTQQVQLGYGIDTGMAVRDDSSGRMVPLGAHVFGSKGYTGRNAVVNAGSPYGTWREYTGGYYSTSQKVSSPTGRMLVMVAASVSQNTSLDVGLQGVFDLRISTNTTDPNYIRAYEGWFYGGFVSDFAIINVTPNTDYYLFWAFRGTASSAGRTATIERHSMFAMPI